MYLPQAVANEFIKRHQGAALPSQAQVQKLVHIANGWNLAVNGEPLVSEPPEAWDNGPVFRRLWNHIRDWGYNSGGRLLGSPSSGEPYEAHLTDSEKRVVDHVWKRYGQFSGSELSGMTHQPDTPWTKAYFGRGRNTRLNNNEIRDHYVKLAMAGREQNA